MIPDYTKPGDKVRVDETWGNNLHEVGMVLTFHSWHTAGRYFRCVEHLKEYPQHNYDVRRFSLVKGAAPAVGRKDDSGKLDMTLLDDMPRALEAVVEVMQWAITKKQPTPYARGSWLGVHADRYRAAIRRHDSAAAKQASNEAGSYPRFQRDDETKLLHLAHTACSALMALENTLREIEKAKS